MGKYSVDTLSQVKLDYANTKMFINIANELAEANRLKRLELWYKLHPSPDISVGSLEKDLEDQA